MQWFLQLSDLRHFSIVASVGKWTALPKVKKKKNIAESDKKGDEKAETSSVFCLVTSCLITL